MTAEEIKSLQERWQGFKDRDDHLPGNYSLAFLQTLMEIAYQLARIAEKP